jgi:hypothetical protein
MKDRLPAFQEQRFLYIPLRRNRIVGLRDFEERGGRKKEMKDGIQE